MRSEVPIPEADVAAAREKTRGQRGQRQSTDSEPRDLVKIVVYIKPEHDEWLTGQGSQPARDAVVAGAGSRDPRSSASCSQRPTASGSPTRLKSSGDRGAFVDDRHRIAGTFGTVPLDRSGVTILAIE